MDPISSGLITACGHNPPVTKAADKDGLVVKSTVESPFHGYKKGIQIEM
jgi:hypothetical protein